tara:strand:+ start:449 stop:1399 length:951 start_codon:yes stop_codon:yes gene_type:complete
VKIKPILIVAGEPDSIFFEIFFKSIKIRIKSPIILICCKKELSKQLKQFKCNKKIREINYLKLNKNYLDNKKINLINVTLENVNNQRSKSLYIEKCFDIALYLIKKKFTKKLINGPIEKKTFLKKKFLGITEYISDKFKIKTSGMLIYNEKLSVSPLTTHLPLKLVSKNITRKNVEFKINLIHTFFKKNFKYAPKIAVTGLNPHCESVLKVNEDNVIVSRAIKSQIKRGIKVKGPYPADTIFLKKNRIKFDVILGMYHDQVLTPLKALFEFNAINITMGLPFLRVSPDHGPNKTMVGKNMSNPISLIKALKFLDKI